MNIIELRSNAPLRIIAILLVIFAVTKFPIKENLAFSDFASEKLEKILISSILIFVLVLIINRLRIPHSYFSFVNPSVYIYYLPAIISLFLFTNGLNDLFHASASMLYSGKAFLYGMAAFAGALFEEILFRGVVFGILLSKYYDSKNGIIKSIFISSALFGIAHIGNIWTRPEQGIDYSTLQLFWAACLGVMYCAIYLKARNIILLGVIHFINNFAANADLLNGSKSVIESVERNSTIAETVVSEVLSIIIVILPLLMGLYIMKRINREDIEKFMGRSCLQSAANGRIDAV